MMWLFLYSLAGESAHWIFAVNVTYKSQPLCFSLQFPDSWEREFCHFSLGTVSASTTSAVIRWQSLIVWVIVLGLLVENNTKSYLFTASQGNLLCHCFPEFRFFGLFPLLLFCCGLYEWMLNFLIVSLILTSFF